MTPDHRTSTRRSGRLRRSFAVLLATVATTATLIPVMATPAAAAASNVTISITSGCSTSRAAGTSTTCTIRVTDSNNKADPTGTASLTLAGTAKAVPLSSTCTLVGISGAGKNYSECTITVVPYTTGTMNTGVTYTSDSAGSWNSATSSATLKTMTVSTPSTFTITSSLKSSTSLSTEASIDVFGFACSVTSGTPVGYLLVAFDADPNVAANNPWVLGPFTVTNGGWSWQTSIPANHPTGRFQAKYICANGSVSGAGDTNIQSISSAYTTTISGTGGSPFTTAALRAPDPNTVVVAQGVADDGDDRATITVSVNQDDLNDVDQLNIVKANADELKRRTDAGLAASSTVSLVGHTLTASGLDRATTDRWTEAVRTGSATGADVAAAVLQRSDLLEFATAPDAEFVAGLYSRAFGRDASTAELAAGAAALQGGTSRAQLVARVTSQPESVNRWRNRSYVVAAFQTVAPTMPAAAQLERFTDELASGWTKVNVVEDIALGVAPAAEWNAAVPAGRMPTSAQAAAPVAAAPAPQAVQPPVAAPAPVVKSPAPKRASAKRRATVRKSRKAVVRKAVVRKAPARKVVAKRTATVRKVRR